MAFHSLMAQKVVSVGSSDQVWDHWLWPLARQEEERRSQEVLAAEQKARRQREAEVEKETKRLQQLYCFLFCGENLLGPSLLFLSCKFVLSLPLLWARR
jgi:hypothetical protein